MLFRWGMIFEKHFLPFLIVLNFVMAVVIPSPGNFGFALGLLLWWGHWFAKYNYSKPLIEDHDETNDKYKN